MRASRPPRMPAPSLRGSTKTHIGRDKLADEGRHIQEYDGDELSELPCREAEPLPVKAPLPDPNKVGWDGPSDPENPHSWSLGYKWFLTILNVVMTLDVTLASSYTSPVASAIAVEFHSSKEVGYLITSMFLLGYVSGTFVWGPGSELYGRKIVFRVSMTCYTILHIGLALAQNMETVLIMRFLAGFFAVAPVTNCAGVLFDIWEPARRSAGFAAYVGGVLCGPTLGPLVGGFVGANHHLGWRWLFWIMMIVSGVILVFVFFVPETYAPVLLQWKARRLREEDPSKNTDVYADHERTDWSWTGVVHRTVYRPAHMLMMEPILLLITIYMALVFGTLYALLEAIPFIFVNVHGFTVAQSGLIFIGVSIGAMIGALCFVPATSHYPRLLVEWDGFPPPEQRLACSMLGGPLLVIGAFWLGWSGNYSSVPWYVPALATIPLGAGVGMICVSLVSYMVDVYMMYAASAMAANTIARSMSSAAFPLFTVAMFDRLGINWACTLIGLFALVMVPSPFCFYKYGPWIRSKSRFAPSPDLQMVEAMKRKAEAEAQVSNYHQHSELYHIVTQNRSSRSR